MKMQRGYLSLGAAALTVLAVSGMGACAASEVVEPEDDGQGGNATTTTTATGPGVGGNSAGGNGSGGEVFPCGQDCSIIDTPPCLQSVCNMGEYPGVVGSCTVVPEDAGTACDDGMFCTVDDACDGAGTCTGGPQNDCGMTPGTCENVTCDEQSKSCGTENKPTGEACVSDDLCLTATTCDAFGACVGTAKDCFFSPVPNECYESVCNPMNGMCEPVPGPSGTACTDPMDLCTVGKTCDGMGVCMGGGPKDCSSLTAGCVQGVCDTVSGACTTTPIGDGMPCEDGNACTSGETCSMGTCSGGVTQVPTVYFSEDFADNNAGWTLGTEWAIGPATTSSGQSFGNPDPATDTTPTADNGVAGVVIGGNASTASVHPMYYLESPVINTAGVIGPMWLGFERHLNSDYTRFMKNVVEVFDGANWQVVWETFGSPGIQDMTWTKQAYDITAYKNANMRVRFGFDIGSSGVFTVSQWNIDDVEVSSAICP